MQRIRPAALWSPLSVWTELALKTGEMMTASSQVIAHRTSRMLKRPDQLTVGDYREFALMGSEKLAAAMESTLGMAAAIASMNWQFLSRAWSQYLAAWNSVARMASTRGTVPALSQQMNLARALTDLGSAGVKLSGPSGRLLARGLKPIHSRARANARRLGKSKRR